MSSDFLPGLGHVRLADQVWQSNRVVISGQASDSSREPESRKPQKILDSLDSQTKFAPGHRPREIYVTAFNRTR